MAIVKRANVVLNVRDYEVERYKNEGYDVIDEAGNIIEATIPTDLNTLQKAYVDSVEKIKKLEAEIAELKGTKTPKSEKVVEEVVVKEVEKAPRATKSKKKIVE